MKLPFKDIIKNLVNKSPKIILVILVFYGLSLHADSLFGVSYRQIKYTLPVEFLEKHYGLAVNLTTTDKVYYTVNERLSGRELGAVVLTYHFADKYIGYGGATPVAVFISTDGLVESVKMLENQETPKFISRLHRAKFFDQFVDKSVQSNFCDIDAVSGVTYSSEAIKNNVCAAMSYATKTKLEVKNSGFMGYIEQFAILAVVVGALLSMIFPAKSKRFRPLLLAASIGVLGIWQGAFVSLELLYKWVIYGTSLTERFGLVAVVLLAVLMPLIFGRSFYCQWVCPFGAAQELAGKLFSRKVSIKTRLLMVFHWIRRLFLVVCVILVIFAAKFNLSDVEPFTFFVIRAASVSVVVLAIGSLLASLVVYRPWCRLLCPTGELLSLLGRKLYFRKKRDKS